MPEYSKRSIRMLSALSILFMSAVVSGGVLPSEEIPTPREMLAEVEKTLPPFSYSVLKDEKVTSISRPDKELRRLEIEFVSQIIDGIQMEQEAVVYLPVDGGIHMRPDRRGKVVVVAGCFFDDTIEWNYAEPIAARTDYPTMHLRLPAAFPGKEADSAWTLYLRDQAIETGDPSRHDFVRLAVPYLQALDVFEDLLEEKNIRAVIGGHSKRAYYAYTAAALDPARIASVIFMGCERLYYRDMFPDAVKPFTTQKYVRCPVFYVGASNEGGYEMFNINRIQERMSDTWTIEYIPNYRHASNSEKQFMAWPMWVSHIFDSRPIAQISGMDFQETETGTIFRARIDSPNKIIQVKAWYVYCDDAPYWRDLVWYPEIMKRQEGDMFEAHVGGILPDAWFVEVKDAARGFAGYLSSLPMDISGKPTAERTHHGPGGRNWAPKKK